MILKRKMDYRAIVLGKVNYLKADIVLKYISVWNQKEG